MEDNVYKAPSADLGQAKPIEVSEEITKKIKAGWIAAIISGHVTFGLILMAINSDGPNGLFNLWSLIDVAIIFALAFGIYMKSRIAATTMFGYFVLSNVLIIVETGQFSGGFLSLVFLYFYFRAMVGTFQYHQALKESQD